MKEYLPLLIQFHPSTYKLKAHRFSRIKVVAVVVGLLRISVSIEQDTQTETAYANIDSITDMIIFCRL